MELARSLMFVPGHRERMVDKAMGLADLDVALLDIEDGVPVAEKDNARAVLSGALGRAAASRPRRFVRVNAVTSDRFDADIAAVVRTGTEGLLLPKVESVGEIRRADQRAGERESAGGLPAGSIAFIVAIESGIGLLRTLEIATASPRVIGVMFGGEDYANDLGLPTDRQGEARELVHARASLVVSAAAARVQAFDGVWPDIQDPEGLRRDSLQARRLGFTGKSLIHPGQIGIINEVFTPSEGDVDYARRVVVAFEEAEARGDGAIAFGGQLIDRPIVERARRVIALWDATR